MSTNSFNNYLWNVSNMTDLIMNPGDLTRKAGRN